MSYCPECGSFSINDITCGSCGHRFVREHEQAKAGIEVPKTDAEGADLKPETVYNSFNENLKPNHITPPSESINFSGGTMAETTTDGTIIRLNEESQLGKGLIKPNSVEIGLDGVHFKYEKPRGNFVKAEPISNKVSEYRAKNGESGFDFAKEEILSKESPDKIKETDCLLQEEPLADEEPPVSVPENEVEVLAETAPITEEFPTVQELTEEENEVGESTEVSEIELMLDEPVPPEPEIKSTPEYDTLWEGNQTFLGIPLINSYRITNTSIFISNRRLRKFSEVDLTLIEEVRLKQSWFDKLFGVGDILVMVKYLTGPGLVLQKIKQPGEVLKLLEDLIKGLKEIGG